MNRDTLKNLHVIFAQAPRPPPDHVSSERTLCTSKVLPYMCMLRLQRLFWLCLAWSWSSFWSESSRLNLICLTWGDISDSGIFNPGGHATVIANAQMETLVQICPSWVFVFVMMLRCSYMWQNFKSMLHFLEPFSLWHSGLAARAWGAYSSCNGQRLPLQSYLRNRKPLRKGWL